MPRRKTRSAREMWTQLELLGPRPQLPPWGSLPASVQREGLTLVARLLRAAWSAASERRRSGEVGDE
jgi:hypothetical protein